MNINEIFHFQLKNRLKNLTSSLVEDVNDEAAEESNSFISKPILDASTFQNILNRTNNHVSGDSYSSNHFDEGEIRVVLPQSHGNSAQQYSNQQPNEWPPNNQQPTEQFYESNRPQNSTVTRRQTSLTRSQSQNQMNMSHQVDLNEINDSNQQYFTPRQKHFARNQNSQPATSTRTPASKKKFNMPEFSNKRIFPSNKVENMDDDKMARL